MGTGKSAGKQGRSSSRALGPPVDTPMTTTSTRRVSHSSCLWIGTCGYEGGIPFVFGTAHSTPSSGGRCDLILGTRSSRIIFEAASLPVPLGGLVTQSTSLYASALSVDFDPLSVNTLNMITGNEGF